MPTVRRNGSVVGLGAVPLGSRSADDECPRDAVVVDLRGKYGEECDRAMVRGEEIAARTGRRLWIVTPAAPTLAWHLPAAARAERRKVLDREYQRRRANLAAGFAPDGSWPAQKEA